MIRTLTAFLLLSACTAEATISQDEAERIHRFTAICLDKSDADTCLAECSAYFPPDKPQHGQRWLVCSDSVAAQTERS